MTTRNNGEDVFSGRHIGPNDQEIGSMLSKLGYKKMADLVTDAVPPSIRMAAGLELSSAASEAEATKEIAGIAAKNKIYKSYLGSGYYGTYTPAVIQRNILENPGWYTQYTPYQAEISQGRLRSLLNFQTVIMDLTGLDVANASVLDEGTAAAEAMAICDAVKNRDHSKAFFVSKDCFAQTIDVVQTRARAKGIAVIVGDHREFDFSQPIFGALLQYPAANGEIFDYQKFIDGAHAQGGLVTMAADILSLCLLKAPGEWGADFAVGSTQRFGVPMGFGGPHAGYMACKQEFLRKLPGRIVGVSKDTEGRSAVRLSLQTREQHIRREKATSNICTSQVLLANMAAMYAVYHGPQGLKNIASQVRRKTALLRAAVEGAGLNVANQYFFDTLQINLAAGTTDAVLARGWQQEINIRKISDESVAVSIDETTTFEDLDRLVGVLTANKVTRLDDEKITVDYGVFARQSKYLEHEVFNSYHSETELMRYILDLSAGDLSLTASMIPLGSCTMKLNAASELMPVSWKEFSQLHPFVPKDQCEGYLELIGSLEAMLCEITGFDAFSLQPNSGAQGEYAGLMAIKGYHEANGDTHRHICLIPGSAHGTNPASAVMAGMKVVVIKCDDGGNIDMKDLREKAEKHANELSAIMITYPSTHGVFEDTIVDICQVIHQHGGQVYLDGANMNAQIGLCQPGQFGADVCHLNLHKTFAIPHGGGGPGVGPIGVKKQLIPHLPTHPLSQRDNKKGMGAISASPFGSAMVLPISWMYIRMMGPKGLKLATEAAILNANYIAKSLEDHYPILYRGNKNLVAHECILDLRGVQKQTGINVEDIAKRLMDYGFHAPTIAWPVPGTMMIEPTESECKRELDRFIEAMVGIKQEIDQVASGAVDKKDNLIKNAPHTASAVTDEKWERSYSRAAAVFPTQWTRDHKFWPKVARIDNAFGDRNFVCSCPGMDAYE